MEATHLYYSKYFPNLEKKLFTNPEPDVWFDFFLQELTELLSIYPTTVENAKQVNIVIEQHNELKSYLLTNNKYRNYKQKKEPVYTAVNNWLRKYFLPELSLLEGERVLFLLQLVTANIQQPEEKRQSTGISHISKIISKLFKSF